MQPREGIPAAGGASRPPARSTYDAVIIGGGHNGLVAAAYLARAGRSVLVLERLGRTGGAAVSTQAFPGVQARLSQYSYLVSLLPRKIVDELGLRFAVRRRRISSYTPTTRDGRPGGLLVDNGDEARTADSFRQLTGSDREFDSWREFYGMTRQVAERVFPSLTEPLPSQAELRERVADPAAWEALFERPIGETVERFFSHDLVRGVVLTDALIGTFTHAHDPSLRQNRCFLYHVIGGGTGDWDVPVGGMGALTDALADAARAAGAEILTGCEVTALDPDGAVAEVAYRTGDVERRVGARQVLSNAAPQTLAGLLGRKPAVPGPQGSQLKVNMLLRRLPRLRDGSVDPREAFAGTFHIAESYGELEAAYREAADGRIPSPAPSEIYCHSLADPSILGPDLAARGFHTLTLFGLHLPAGLFTEGGDATRRAALDAVLAPLDACLDEPLADCLALDGEGRPCIEVKSPLDLEHDLGLPGGNIFHQDLEFPYGDGTDNRWGVATGHPKVLLCGAGALRGGGVSGIPGHNAAMAALGR
ncbi:NAD(P)/FAD-dependent oxidoreductase [Kitasatospora atroaurantiaca]|uniref:Pyridine nucleotide-disulfide oxidoreductase domain-containing protein 2 n=1 Tax=Kitasatospora atroaurantiaca TaxID=285545 RepID=A0A561EJV2_9ACTN|nr:NAD(P)/FAD-dependent oxidoreductase [Kitasatospora atroaurantiaca]TWE15897.1 phytoene dehydrogenase-like protein [Kitasatospora atroaurantiaca]